MIINYLELENFRQFLDVQRINFSTDSDKLVTIVRGESGEGKTTIIQSFGWILYGECKYRSPVNSFIESTLEPGKFTEVRGTLNIIHGQAEYTITRIQKFYKTAKTLTPDIVDFFVDCKKEDGTTEQKRGKDADKIIRQIMHKDLFHYFFLEGENLTSYGERMSKGSASSRSEFSNAVKGLLGFNFLYSAKSHLEKAIRLYDDEIARNTISAELKRTLERIKGINQQIETIDSRLESIDDEIEQYKRKRDEISEKLSRNKKVGAKQQKAVSLGNEIKALYDRIIEKRKALFKKFSSSSFNALLLSLLPEARETLKKSDSLDKGIPGINVTAIEYLLSKHRCLCGCELKEGSEEWEEVKKYIDLLPPNSIGTEISRFERQSNSIENSANTFLEDFKQLRKDYSELVTDYNKKISEKEDIDSEIRGSSIIDIGELKRQEEEYGNKIVRLSTEKQSKQSNKISLIREREQLEEKSNQLQNQDKKVEKLRIYRREAEYLRDRIVDFSEKREKEKRRELEEAMNGIFKEFYNEKISISIDNNYGVKIVGLDQLSTEDFTSGGQDVAVALAFIGAIIRLNKEKSAQIDEEIDEEKESYPLVLDAPTSNFGMKQMESFSSLMPNITDQIIVFINDKDGPILERKMADKIGVKYSLHKEDSYHCVVREEMRYVKKDLI